MWVPIRRNVGSKREKLYFLQKKGETIMRWMQTTTMLSSAQANSSVDALWCHMLLTCSCQKQHPFIRRTQQSAGPKHWTETHRCRDACHLATDKSLMRAPSPSITRKQHATISWTLGNPDLKPQVCWYIFQADSSTFSFVECIVWGHRHNRRTALHPGA